MLAIKRQCCRCDRRLMPVLAMTATAGRSRKFHDYFVSHIPSPSLHPDRPRPTSTGSTGADDHTVVRIPLRSAKHHFGAFSSRGSRPQNEDEYQAGVIEIAPFAPRPTEKPNSRLPAQPADSTVQSEATDRSDRDPQVFYFAVFDGHGGDVCSRFLREELHQYIESSGRSLGHGSDSVSTSQTGIIHEKERNLVQAWRDLVGGYFRRFQPKFFPRKGGGLGQVLVPDGEPKPPAGTTESGSSTSLATVLEHAFLQADYDFVAAQASKADDSDATAADRALNEADILDRPHARAQKLIGDPSVRFVGGSTASTLLISSPDRRPFWSPAGSCSIMAAHVGDSRIVLCDTTTGDSVALTHNHHPDLPSETARLRKYSTAFMTDSFGEQRLAGLANTRAFGDVKAKRMGVSAEPELRQIDVRPSQYSFAVLVSDGISGVLSDQEIVDVVKEAPTPDEAAKRLVGFAADVSTDGDNLTALVIRLGGWDRRCEGGTGSLGSKSLRDWRLTEALDPRRARQ